ncbi:hypothetical protein UNPF46_20240, partial [Bradyrhizobium sp. UNPF46]
MHWCDEAIQIVFADAVPDCFAAHAMPAWMEAGRYEAIGLLNMIPGRDEVGPPRFGIPKFCLTEIRKYRICRASRPMDKGRFAIVTIRGRGGGGRGVHRRAGNRRAGLARERLSSAHT